MTDSYSLIECHPCRIDERNLQILGLNPSKRNVTVVVQFRHANVQFPSRLIFQNSTNELAPTKTASAGFSSHPQPFDTVDGPYKVHPQILRKPLLTRVSSEAPSTLQFAPNGFEKIICVVNSRSSISIKERRRVAGLSISAAIKYHRETRLANRKSRARRRVRGFLLER